MPAGEPMKYSPGDFQKIISYLDQKRSEINVVTISQLYSAEIIQNESPKEDIGQKIVWEDQFDTAQLDSKSWNVISRPPSANNELQTYTKENVITENGYLNILSTQPEDGQYYSGAVSTENKRLFLYGKIEVRAKLCSGKGIFPAIWMIPQSGDSFPEIDILEYRGHERNVIWHVYHFFEANQKERDYYLLKKNFNFDEDYHIYGLEWTKDRLIWSVDGVDTYSANKNVPSVKMFLYINTAIGGDWPGNPDRSTKFPTTMLIDYVKYSR
jgi:beta-glucanase (GH16 family)